MIPAKAKRVGMGAYAKGNAVAVRGKDWADRQDPATRRGATIGWYRRFRESDGGLFAVLLTAYLFITVIPATVVMMGYVYNDPTKLADRLSGRLDLTGSVKTMLDSVLAGASGHQFVATLIAVFNVLFFGLGFGRVLQIAHARAWRIDLGKPQFFDQARYLVTLVVLLGFLLVFILQTRALHGQPGWIGWVLLPVWLFALLSYFVWVPRMLLHRRVTHRDVVPGAVFTLLGLVGLRLLSALLFRHWLVWYSMYYGSLGIVMALFFWILIYASLLILAAALAPALAHRRDLRQARAVAA
ncbi:MAG TPA: YhjD/YihY/BrkB family envelope integrity protein [Gaiellaceae bacterium]|nr:YhjD/YihY/BrkB family envelope integrity protein [Gaiellaceae bacterium]